MTTIAYRDGILAADKQATDCGLAFAISKLWRLRRAGGDELLLAACGNADAGLAMRDWYERGASREDFPEIQKGDDWCRLIVVTREGVKFFERLPYAIQPDPAPFMAWGSGRDFALGAMALGASAVEAVEIASRFDVHSGMGVDSMALDMPVGSVPCDVREEVSA